MSTLPNLFDVELLLRLHWDPEAMQRYHDSPSTQRALKVLEAAELITPRGCGFVTTERARVYVEAIRNLPLPEQSWHMPKVKAL